MVIHARQLAIVLASAALLGGGARAGDAQDADRPSHRTKPAISAPGSPEQQEAAKKANADYRAAKLKARAEYRKALADAKAAHDAALRDIRSGDTGRR